MYLSVEFDTLTEAQAFVKAYEKEISGHSVIITKYFELAYYCSIQAPKEFLLENWDKIEALRDEFSDSEP